MGKVVVTEFVSLDMVMEAPGGEHGYAHTGWVVPYQEGDQINYPTLKGQVCCSLT